MVSAAVGCEPVAGWEPDHPPAAVQEVALVDDQFRVALPPLATVLGLALKAMVGAGAATDTVTDCIALPPPVPLQSKMNVELEVSAPVDFEPLLGSDPDQDPKALHDEGLVADQVSIELPPLATVLGFAVRVTIGAVDGVTVTLVDCAALPPAPLHDRV